MSDKKLQVIVLAGWSCAGKSIIAEKLAENISFDLIKVYEVYHSLALKKGYSRSHEWLKDVGDKNFVKETVYEVVSKIKSFESSKGIVIDGSFTFLMNYILNSELLNAHIIDIAVLSRFKVRLNRMVKRMNISCKDAVYDAVKELIFRDGFLERIHLVSFLRVVDFEVWNENDGDIEIEKVIKEIKSKLGSSLGNYCILK